MRILIKHSTGSKANRIEQLSIGDLCEDITLGRDTAASVTYDPEKDDLVSRRHALIRTEKKDGELSFAIEDLQSRNGTFVNGQRLTGVRELLPGDVVELGGGGPKFTFDVEPRPPHLMARTQTARTDEEHLTTATAATGASEHAPHKVGVGRSTVVEMLSEQFNRANRRWMYIVAGVLSLVVVVGAGLYFQNVMAERRVTIRVDETVKRNEASGKVTPKEIANEYSGSTVLIQTKWRLTDEHSGKQVFIKRVTHDGKELPAYVRLKNGEIVWWLVLDDQVSPASRSANTPIATEVRGSGFVIRRDGVILTNKHIVTPWESTYFECDGCVLPAGLLFKEMDPGSEWEQQGEPYQPALDTEKLNGKNRFVPANFEVTFGDKKPVRIPSEFHPRREKLQVHLPGVTAPFDARLVRVGSRADVALIKIDPPDPMKPVPLADADYKPALGEPITVIGYPVVSMETYEVAQFMEDRSPRTEVREIAQPTVVEGIISNIGGGIVHSEENIIRISMEGEAYQMSISPTGSGNSGGPIFNSIGNTIGILTSQKTGRSGEIVFFGTPIRAAYELLRVK